MVPIVFVTSMAVTLALGRLLGVIVHSEWRSAAIARGILADAGANWFVGRKLNRQPPRELINAMTNEPMLIYERHKLFWIPMPYWSIPVSAIALIALLSPSGHAAP